VVSLTVWKDRRGKGRYSITFQRPVKDSFTSWVFKLFRSHTPPLARGFNRRPVASASFSIHRRGTDDRFRVVFSWSPPPLKLNQEIMRIIQMIFLHAHIRMAASKPHLFYVYRRTCRGWLTSMTDVFRQKFDTTFIQCQCMANSTNVLGGRRQWKWLASENPDRGDSIPTGSKHIDGG
jgi:hypothetical protein